MKDVYKNWDSASVFEDQLALNIKELSSEESYPMHWHHFLHFVREIEAKSILDLGCGCGAYYQLCKRYFPDLKYTGADFSQKAVDLAKKTWNYDGFIVKNLFELTSEEVRGYDVIHLGALLDVLENGDEGLRYLLSLNPKSVLIGRMELTDRESFSVNYKAYDKIDTVQFHHNTETVLSIAKTHNYSVSKLGKTVLFQKHDIQN